MAYKKIIIATLIIIITASCAFSQNDFVTTNAQGEECLSIARDILLSYGLKVDRNILVEVCSVDVFKGHHTVVSGGTGEDVGGYYQSHSPESIWIIEGYRREYAIGIFAHELAHAWQSTEAPEKQEKILKEGFATWCQYKVLMSMGAKYLAKRLFSLPNTDYSHGLRIYVNIEAKNGIPAVIDYARTALSVQ